METPVVEIENNLDKECSALGGLFQQIISEMKVREKKPILYTKRTEAPLLPGNMGVSESFMLLPPSNNENPINCEENITATRGS